MNSYFIPAEYQLGDHFGLLPKPPRDHRRHWGAATLAVAIIFGVTLALVAGAETTAPAAMAANE